MKRLLCIFVLLLATASLLADSQIPEARGLVNDQADLLNDRDIRRLDAKARAYRDQTGNEVAVLIVMTLGNRSLEDYAHDVFQTWGIGSKENDNGVLFLVTLEEREARIEVGYGLEGELTDIECGRLVNRNSPMALSFRKHDYAGGVSAVLDGIEQAIGGEYNPPQPKGDNESNGTSSVLMFVFIFSIVVLIIRSRGLGSSRRYGGTVWGGGRTSGGGGFTLGGGSGFGGGGGFGGGSSGGGGASGGW